MAHIVVPRWKDEIVRFAATAFKPGEQHFASGFDKFELYWSLGFLLHHHRAISDAAAGYDITDPNLDDVATAQLVINREIEELPLTRRHPAADRGRLEGVAYRMGPNVTEHPLASPQRCSTLLPRRATKLVLPWVGMGSTIPDLNAASLADALRAVAAGDRAAFEDVYRRTSVKLFGVCLRILPVKQEAEEALQEAYLSVWRRAGTFDGTKGSAMTWLITLTRNRAVDRLRSGRNVATAPIDFADEMPDPAPAASTLLEIGEDRQRLAYCLGTLDGDDAGLIRTAFFEGSTYAELASRTATPLGTIKSRIRRALLKLKDCLS